MADDSFKRSDTLTTMPSVMTVDQAARVLRINRKTVYDAVAAGQLPGARRVGRSIRIMRDAMIEWLSQDRVPRSSERRR
jgi:excisionase family DNA binding protein